MTALSCVTALSGSQANHTNANPVDGLGLQSQILEKYSVKRVVRITCWNVMSWQLSDMMLIYVRARKWVVAPHPFVSSVCSHTHS